MNISLDKLRNIKFKQVIYPISLVIFALAVGSVFWKSISFISKAINTSLSVDTHSVDQGKLKIDLATYYRVAEKLNIPTPAPDSGETPEPTAEPAASSSPIASPAASSVAKSELQLAVFNSTKTSGLAANLTTKLAQAGFTVAKTGNQSPAQPTTVIKTGARVSDAIFNEIVSILSPQYANPTRQTLPASSAYDVEIVIGNK